MVQALTEKLEHFGLAEKERMARCHRESSSQERQSRLCQKENEQSFLSKVPNHIVKESQGKREPHFSEREREIRAGAWREKVELHCEGRQVPRR